MFALAVAGWVDPACRPDVARTIADRFRWAAEAARRRPVTILPSLAHLALMTPDLPDAARTLAREILADDEDEE